MEIFLEKKKIWFPNVIEVSDLKLAYHYSVDLGDF